MKEVLSILNEKSAIGYLANQSPDNPIFKIFYLEHGKVTIDNFSNPQRSFEF